MADNVFSSKVIHLRGLVHLGNDPKAPDTTPLEAHAVEAGHAGPSLSLKEKWESMTSKGKAVAVGVGALGAYLLFGRK